MKSLKYACMTVVFLTLTACGQMGAPVAEVAPDVELAPLAATTECSKNVDGKGTLTCVTTTVTEGTKFVQRTATEFAERTVTEDVVTTATEFVERPATGPCQVGNSDRVGVAEGIATDEVLITTTETFDVILRDEFLVTLQDEFLVTTTTVTKEVFRGGEPNPKQLISSVTNPPKVEEELVETTELSRVLQNTVEVSRTLVNTDVQSEVVGTTFTQTGKCKNVSGPQS